MSSDFSVAIYVGSCTTYTVGSGFSLLSMPIIRGTGNGVLMEYEWSIKYREQEMEQ